MVSLTTEVLIDAVIPVSTSSSNNEHHNVMKEVAIKDVHAHEIRRVECLLPSPRTGLAILHRTVLEGDHCDDPEYENDKANSE